MKLSIANLLLVTGLIAVCVGWWSERSNSAAKFAKLDAERVLRDKQIYTGSKLQGRIFRLKEALGAIHR